MAHSYVFAEPDYNLVRPLEVRRLAGQPATFVAGQACLCVDTHV